MTLVMAMYCKDGIVMASDGQATGNSAGGAVRHVIPKIFPVGKSALYGASGTIGMIQKGLEIVQSLGEKFDEGLTKDLRMAVRDRLLELSTEAQAIQRQYYGNSEGAPLADIIICARDGSKKYKIWHIGKDGNEEFLDSVGYACTGGGDIFGYSMLSSLGIREFDIESGKLIAYRIIKNAIEVGAYGLGKPIDIWSISDSGKVVKESAVDIEAIGKAYLKLREEDAKSIRRLSSIMRNVVGK